LQNSFLNSFLKGWNSVNKAFPSQDSCLLITDMLQWKASQQRDQVVYRFLTDGEIHEETLTYGELDHKARNLAVFLQKNTRKGDRVLLLYPSGLDYIIAFFGCLYAGVIAVPMYPPRSVRSDRSLPRLLAIKNDTQAVLALTTNAQLRTTEKLFKEILGLEHLPAFATDTLSEDMAQDWSPPAINENTLAFLQYTSGTTGSPRGVMITHGNLAHNQSMIRAVCNLDQGTLSVNWLPLYHDMGLIANILYPIFAGIEVVLMSPVAFLQRPFRWLDAISRYKADGSGGPNFAYDLCVRKITAEQRATLDLSDWKIAFSGAEPLRSETLERFAETFAPCGFRREAFVPGYGLAEATLFVAGGSKDSLVRYFPADEAALAHKQVLTGGANGQKVKTLVSNGPAHPDQKICIVDPDTLSKCDPTRIGEVWTASPSVAQGYWNKVDETRKTFDAYTEDGEGPFLRTGDLGFLYDDELYITGRLKDLIIIRGRNIYPQDVELTVEKSHEILRSESGAAFSLECDGEERLIIAHEVERTYKYTDLNVVGQNVCQAIAENHEVQPYKVLFLKMGTLPKTSSGKVQRHLACSRYLADELELVGEYHA
jgi:acyl-CoA synthetase (AMP-forming)/AMP-acid ligase II